MRTPSLLTLQRLLERNGYQITASRTGSPGQDGLVCLRDPDGRWIYSHTDRRQAVRAGLAHLAERPVRAAGRLHQDEYGNIYRLVLVASDRNHPDQDRVVYQDARLPEGGRGYQSVPLQESTQQFSVLDIDRL